MNSLFPTKIKYFSKNSGKNIWKKGNKRKCNKSLSHVLILQITKGSLWGYFPLFHNITTKQTCTTNKIIALCQKLKINNNKSLNSKKQNDRHLFLIDSLINESLNCFKSSVKFSKIDGIFYQSSDIQFLSECNEWKDYQKFITF